MYNLKLMIRILEPRTIRKVLAAFAVFGIVPLGDIYLILLIGHAIGNYLILAIICLLSFAGIFISLKFLSNILLEIDIKQKRGLFPEDDFNALITGILGSFMILLPGPLSTVIGLILQIPVIKITIGKAISIRAGIDWGDIYEYMKVLKQD